MVVAPAWAGSYKFQILDFPGSIKRSTVAAAIGPDNTVGGYFGNKTGGGIHGFLWTVAPGPSDAGTYTQIDVPGARFTQIWGISPLRVVVGEYWNSPGNASLFTYDIATGHFRTVVTGLGELQVTTMSMNRAGTIVGGASANPERLEAAFEVRDGVFRYTARPAPAKAGYRALAINTAGLVAGTGDVSWQTVGPSYFFAGGKDTLIEAPNVAATVMTALTDTGTLIGYTVNPPSEPPGSGIRVEGFTLSDGIFTKIDVPHAGATYLLGQTWYNSLVGGYYRGARSYLFAERKGHFRSIGLPAGVYGFYPLHANREGSILGWTAVAGWSVPIAAICSPDQVPCLQ